LKKTYEIILEKYKKRTLFRAVIAEKIKVLDSLSDFEKYKKNFCYNCVSLTAKD